MYVIQQRVGHSNSRVTQEIYTHVTHEALVKNRDQLEKFMTSWLLIGYLELQTE